jgi:hypothetical protein
MKPFVFKGRHEDRFEGRFGKFVINLKLPPAGSTLDPNKGEGIDAGDFSALLIALTEIGVQRGILSDAQKRELKSVLYPQKAPGRKASSRVNEATRMHREGKKWLHIYQLIIPKYKTMSGLEKTHAQQNLRGAVRKQLKREADKYPS